MALRHEKKYLINYYDFVSLKNRLSVVMSIDSNANENNEYIVRSLYFDNIYDSVLKDKINGVNYREKFRIRIYNKDIKHIKLEKKSKINGLSEKKSVYLTKEECSLIIANNIEWMKDSDRDLLRELYLKMRFGLLKPKMIVEYIRTPFIDYNGNVRITFDRKIRSSINDVNILDFDIPLILKHDDLIIMEVKYDEFIPIYIQNLIKLNKTSQVAYSKYGNNRIF